MIITGVFSPPGPSIGWKDDPKFFVVVIGRITIRILLDLQLKIKVLLIFFAVFNLNKIQGLID